MENDDKEILLTGRGVVLVTFLTDNKDAGRVQYFKNLFLQMAERNGMTRAVFTEYAGIELSPVLSFHAAILQYLGADKERTAHFVQWLFDKGYLNDSDVMGAFNVMVYEPPKQSKNFQPVTNSMDELKKKQPIWVQVLGTPDNNGFNVTISINGQEWTYPEKMGIEEACSCADWFAKQQRLSWDAVFIPVNDIIKQADKSLACRRTLKEMQAEGLM